MFMLFLMESYKYKKKRMKRKGKYSLKKRPSQQNSLNYIQIYKNMFYTDRVWILTKGSRSQCLLTLDKVKIQF